MKIICLVKQVPDTEAKIKVKPETKDIDREGLNMVLNPYDEFAVEEAIKLKEAKVAESVTVITVGEKKAEEAVRTALAMGADSAIRVEDPAVSLKDPASVAAALAAAAKSVGADLILCGKQASDDDSSAVGLMVADMLGMPCVNVVLKLAVADGKLTATREIEGGEETVECPLPAVITCTKGLNEPRYPSLPGIMKAKKKPLDVKAGADIGLSGADAKTEIAALNPPPARAEGKKFEGDPAEIVAKVVKALREEAKVI